MGQTNAAWKQKTDVKKQHITKHVLQQWRWIVFGAPSQHWIKHHKQKTRENTNSGATLYFCLDLRACLSIPENQAPQVPSWTQRNQLTLLGKETRPIRTYFTSRHAKPTLQNLIYQLHRF
jgi:hypothetical protein